MNAVLIVPMQPTPNGRMHIGHGAGTYLRADVLARALRLRGHRVHVITGSDAFENWVLAEAARTGRTPEQACEYYHHGIRRDLENLGVLLDGWIDPRSPEHLPGYRAIHEQALLRLRETGAAMLEAEQVPFSVATGRAQVGTWIAGRCPNCGRPCGGSSCVVCGEHFQPEEVVDARSRLDNSALRWETRKNWFARPSDPDRIVERLRGSGVRARFLDAVVRYLGARGGRIRLTGAGTWGIHSDLAPPDSVLSNGYYLYSVYCGEVYRQITSDSVNAFAPDSGVITIGVFGNDNSTPGMVAPHVIAQGSPGMLKPFDFTIVNGMLQFEGQKCSTSKRHGIWLTELVEGTSIAADELRFGLLTAPLDDGPADITLQKIVDAINGLRTWRASALAPAMRTVAVGEPECRDQVFRAVERQHAHLRPEYLNLPGAFTELRAWMSGAAGADSACWLLGIALLAEPLLPELGRTVWTRLGLPGAPVLDVAHAAAPNPAQVAAPVLSPRGATELTAGDLLPFVHRAVTET